MNKYINAIMAVLSAAGGLVIHYLGGLDQLLMALLALIVVDLHNRHRQSRRNQGT